jgi:hypothetical protein
MFLSLSAAAPRRISNGLLVDEEGRLLFQILQYWAWQFVVSYHHNPRNGGDNVSQRQVDDQIDTPGSHHIQLVYVDDNGDRIELSTNEEFVYALFDHFGTVSHTNAEYHGFDLTPASHAPKAQTILVSSKETHMLTSDMLFT